MHIMYTFIYILFLIQICYQISDLCQAADGSAAVASP